MASTSLTRYTFRRSAAGVALVATAVLSGLSVPPVAARSATSTALARVPNGARTGELGTSVGAPAPA